MPSTRTTTFAAASAAVLLVSAVGAATASAADTDVTGGGTVLRPSGAAFRALDRADVSVRALGRAKTAKGRITVPVSGGSVGTVSTLRHAASSGLQLRNGRRKVRITGLQVRLGKASVVRGRVNGGALRTVFTLKKAPGLTVDGSRLTATRSGARVVLTSATARRLRSALKLRRVPASTFATASFAATLAPRATPAPTVVAPAPTTTSTTPAPAPTAPAPTTPTAPTAPTTPTTPVDPPATVTSVADWGVKTSFRNYISGPIARGKVETTEGATRNADGTYRFPGSAFGAFDPATAAASGPFKGQVYFEGHGSGELAQLRVWITNPRIVVDAGGTSGSLYADVRSRGFESPTIDEYPNVKLAQLAPTEAMRSTSGDTTTFAAVPATLTEEGAPAFGGFYGAGEALDPVTFQIQQED